MDIDKWPQGDKNKKRLRDSYVDEITEVLNGNSRNEEDVSIRDSEEKIGKSGRFQSFVDRLADIQHDISYGLSLIRLNDWYNPSNVREEDRALYEEYTSRIEKLEFQKKEVIDEMIEKIKQDDKYKDLSEKDLRDIRDHIDAGSTRHGFYFNDESINKIMKKNIWQNREETNDAPSKILSHNNWYEWYKSLLDIRYKKLSNSRFYDILISWWTIEFDKKEDINKEGYYDFISFITSLNSSEKDELLEYDKNKIKLSFKKIINKIKTSIDKLEEPYIYWAATILLANADRWKSIYNWFNQENNSWFRIKVLLGKEHYKQFLEDKKKCETDLEKADHRSKKPLTDWLKSSEITYLINNTINANWKQLYFWSHLNEWETKFPKTVLTEKYVFELEKTYYEKCFQNK